VPGAVPSRRHAIAGAVALLALSCGYGTITAPGGGGPAPVNQEPVITVGPTVSSSPLPEGTATQVSVTADDADGDSLGYAWTQVAPASPQGIFSSRTLRNPTWTAPAVTADTPFRLQVTVIDGQGGSTAGTLDLLVTHRDVNRPPSVSVVAVSPAAPVAGEVVSLSITASDPDGDPLTIAWAQSAPTQQGTFSGTSQPSVTWISPPIGVPSLDFTFEVTVSDGKSPVVEREVKVTVMTPSYGANVQPLWDARCTSCHPSDGQLDLRTGTSYGQLVGVTQVGGGACAGEKRVDATSPSASSLLGWLTGDCGTAMPPPPATLSTGERVTIQSWILSGAAP